jgi:hypothetical protein
MPCSRDEECMAMEEIQCCHCGGFFPRCPRHKEQYYCMKPACRRARKAAWKRQKMRTDPDYRLNQKLSNRKWAEANPGYWKAYRKGNPQKTERNRMLQRIRNRRRSKKGAPDATAGSPLIAKVDRSASHRIKVAGQFWMVPVIAKGDAVRVYMYEIPTPYQ